MQSLVVPVLLHGQAMLGSEPRAQACLVHPAHPTRQPLRMLHSLACYLPERPLGDTARP